MQVTCGVCGSRCSVPERAPGDANRREVCSLCGAVLAVRLAGSEPRGQMDTLRLDASSLATLVRLGETTHAAATNEESKGPRAPQLSIPFELARRRTVPLTAPQALQPSVPSDLHREGPVPVPPPHPSLVELRRESEANDWEKTFAARVRRRQWGLVVGVVVAVFIVVAFALITSGRVNPMRLFDRWGAR